MNHGMIQILRTSTKIAGVAGLALVALGPFAAHAENQMNPGAMCVSGSNTNLPDVSAYGDARNPSDSTMNLVCPIVRGSFAPAGSMIATAYVTDRHYDDEVCCYARSKQASGSSYITSANVCTDGTGTYKPLSMGVSGNNGSNDIRFLVCSLPARYLGDPANVSIIHGFRGIEL